jgi:hypothetical protein
MAKKNYRPKVGADFEMSEEWRMKLRHTHRMELIVLPVGAIFILLYFASIFLGITITGRNIPLMASIIAIGVAACTTGIAGTLDVKYRGTKLVASGGLGLGAFLLVIVATVFLPGC